MTTPAPRRSETPAMARRICFAQGIIICPLCGERILPTDKVIREHLHALGLEGSDDEDNQAYVHFPCAQKKTNGTPATTYGSDIHAIAKVKRLAAGGRKRKGRKMQSAKTIPSRPFQQRRIK